MAELGSALPKLQEGFINLTNLKGAQYQELATIVYAAAGDGRNRSMTRRCIEARSKHNEEYKKYLGQNVAVRDVQRMKTNISYFKPFYDV